MVEVGGLNEIEKTMRKETINNEKRELLADFWDFKKMAEKKSDDCTQAPKISRSTPGSFELL